MNRSIRVIVGDDDANDRFFLQRAFLKICPNVTIDFARNGEEVIRFLKDESQPVPSLLLLDSMMAKMNGFDVLEWLRPEKQFAQVPVVMMTGQLSDANATRAQQCGVKAYVAKPEGMTGLEAFVKDLNEKYLNPTA